VIKRVTEEPPPTRDNFPVSTPLDRLKKKNWYIMAALLFHDNFVEIKRTDLEDPDV
jgi:hypothetical protein